MAATYSSVFEQALALASEMSLYDQQLQPQPDSGGGPATLVHGLRGYIFVCDQYSSMQCRMLHLEALERVPLVGVTDQSGKLLRAVAALDHVVDHKANLTTRLKDLNSKHALPVETEHQQHFHQLLDSTAKHAEMLGHGHAGLGWVGRLAIQPARWEDYLKPLPALQQVCQEFHELSLLKSSILSKLGSEQAAPMPAGQ